MEESTGATEVEMPGEVCGRNPEPIELAGGKVRVTVGEEALSIQVGGHAAVPLTPQEAEEIGAVLSNAAVIVQAEECNIPALLSVVPLGMAIAFSIGLGFVYLIEHTPTPSGWEGPLTGWRKFAGIGVSAVVAPILSMCIGVLLGVRISKRISKLSTRVGWIILAGVAVWLGGSCMAIRTPPVLMPALTIRSTWPNQ